MQLVKQLIGYNSLSTLIKQDILLQSSMFLVAKMIEQNLSTINTKKNKHIIRIKVIVKPVKYLFLEYRSAQIQRIFDPD